MSDYGFKTHDNTGKIAINAKNPIFGFDMGHKPRGFKTFRFTDAKTYRRLTYWLTQRLVVSVIGIAPLTKNGFICHWKSICIQTQTPVVGIHTESNTKYITGWVIAHYFSNPSSARTFRGIIY